MHHYRHSQCTLALSHLKCSVRWTNEWVSEWINEWLYDANEFTLSIEMVYKKRVSLHLNVECCTAYWLLLMNGVHCLNGVNGNCRTQKHFHRINCVKWLNMMWISETHSLTQLSINFFQWTNGFFWSSIKNVDMNTYGSRKVQPFDDITHLRSMTWEPHSIQVRQSTSKSDWVPLFQCVTNLFRKENSFPEKICQEFIYCMNLWAGFTFHMFWY